MKERTISYNYYHWGPYLYRSKLQEEEIIQIKSLCKKDKKKDIRKKLAGFIKEEYKISARKLFPIIFPYIDSYAKGLFEYSNKVLGSKITLKGAWVNYMKKYETNPLHDHDSDLSFVLYTDIPKNLKEEADKAITSGTKPGNINFIINYSTDGFNWLNSHSFLPERGDIFIFPANLSHYVDMFKSEGERISVSGNLVVTKNKN